VNAAIEVSTPTPEAALADAHDRVEKARTKLDQANAVLTRAREITSENQREADRLAAEEARWIERHSKKLSAWIEGGGRGARPVAAADAEAVQRQMSARANAAAAAEALTRFETAEQAARQELQAAEAECNEAARQSLFAEIRAEFETYRQQAREMAATREWLFAAYLSQRGALTPQEWLELDTSIGATSDAMQIGSPWLEIPLNRLEQTGSRDRPAQARARINALIPEFQARLEELASGGESAEQPEDAA
jgi:hypothetical protein